MSPIKSKKSKKSSVSKSKQSLITAGLAVVFVDQVLAAAGKNSDIADRSKDTLRSEKQMPATEVRPESASSENGLVQSNDNAEAEQDSEVAQNGQEALTTAAADDSVLNESEEIGSGNAEELVQNLPPQGNELLLAQADVAASGAVEASAGVVEATATAGALGAISPFAIFGAIAAVGLTAGSSSSVSTVAPTEAPTTAPTEAPTTAPTEAPTTAPTEAPSTAPTEAPETLPPAAIVETLAAKGILSGSTVYYDFDGNGEYTIGEPFAITSSNGKAFIELNAAQKTQVETGLNSQGKALKVIVSGGTDVTNGKVFTGSLSSVASTDTAVVAKVNVFSTLKASGMSDSVLRELMGGRALDSLTADDFNSPTAGLESLALKLWGLVSAKVGADADSTEAAIRALSNVLEALDAAGGDLNVLLGAGGLSAEDLDLLVGAAVEKAMDLYDKGYTAEELEAALSDFAEGLSVEGFADGVVTEDDRNALKESALPTDAPTEAPTTAPTVAPTEAPTTAPTSAPTEAPTSAPTEAPTTAPTSAPTEAPTTAPTVAPTEAPTTAPTSAPTEAPTTAPTTAPTDAPTSAPTDAPTTAPTVAPTSAPTDAPTTAPTVAPTSAPTDAPTTAPTVAPTSAPTDAPTTAPTVAPTSAPTDAPTTAPVTKISGPLVGLAALAVNPVQGNAGDSFLIEGGVGVIGNATLESLGLSFADNLNVTLDLQTGDAGSDGFSDSTIQLNTSFAGLAGLGIDHITGDANQNVTITSGLGAIGADTLESLGLSFADNLNVTLDLQTGDSATDGVSDGTIQLNTSLAGLADLGIDHITGDANQNVTIASGLGAIGTDTLESLGLSFADNLNVTLDLQTGDAGSDGFSDSTIQLNTSFAGLAGLGIDHITGVANQNVTIASGLGDIKDATLQSLGLSFADNLNVTLDLQTGDSATDGVSDGTIQLNTSLAGLADLGIDHITGDAGQDVFIAGGIGGFDSVSVNLSTLASGGFSFASNLDVTVSVSTADLAGYSIGSGGWIGVTSDLAAIGVDTISVGTADVSLADISALISSGLDFAATDNISLVDTDVEGTLMAGSGITLNDLADLGIDTIDADADASITFTIVAGGGVVENMSSVDLEKALSDILAKFDGVVFADQDNVSLDIGSNAAAVADLGQSLLSGIELLGIDAFSNGDVELWNKNTAI